MKLLRIVLVLTLLPFATALPEEAPAPRASEKGADKKLEAKDFVGALAEYDRVLEATPRSAHALFGRSQAKMELGDYDGTFEDLQKIMDFDPKNVQAYFDRGLLKQMLGDLKGAMKDMDLVLSMEPNTFFAYGLRGMLKQELGDSAGALEDCQRGIEISPYYKSVYFDLARVYCAQRSWDEAHKAIRRGIELCPKNEGGNEYRHFFLWLMRVRSGEKEAADKELADYLPGLKKEVPTEDERWTAQVGDFLVGKTAEADFIAAASSADLAKQIGQQCEAWFYAGMKRLFSGDKAGAVDCFKRCLATQKKIYIEYQLAEDELKELGK